MSNWERDRYFPEPPAPTWKRIAGVFVGLATLFGGLAVGAAALVLWGLIFACIMIPIAAGFCLPFFLIDLFK